MPKQNQKNPKINNQKLICRDCCRMLVSYPFKTASKSVKIKPR